MRIFIGSNETCSFLYCAGHIAADNAIANLAFSLFVLWEVIVFFFVEIFGPFFTFLLKHYNFCCILDILAWDFVLFCQIYYPGYYWLFWLALNTQQQKSPFFFSFRFHRHRISLRCRVAIQYTNWINIKMCGFVKCVAT